MPIIIFATSLLLAGSIFGILATNPSVHGQTTGAVCLIASGTTPCPTSPAPVGGTVGTQIRVSVFIQVSNTLNGFDITLLVDHTILKPAGADLTGTVLPGPQTIIAECVGGVLVHGNTCPLTDTPDTLHFVAFACPGCFTAQPTTGLLFTAIYNITAASSGIPLGYQTGCPSPTSVPNSTTCVYILNGSTAPDPETVQTAVFTTADFTIAANPTTLTVARGSQTTSTITLTSPNGFSGTISLSTLVTPGTHRPPTASLSSSSVTLTSGGSASISLTVFTTKNTAIGSYTVVVSGTSGSISSSASVSLTVTR